MSELVGEIQQRLTPRHMKDRAKEVAVRETRHMKDRIVDSPLALGILGGLVTAGVARWMRSRRFEGGSQERRFGERRSGYAGYGEGYSAYGERTYGERGYGYRDDEAGSVREQAAGMREKATETAENLREKATETAENLRNKASETAENLRERAGDLKEKAAEFKNRAGELAHRAKDKIPSTEDVKQASRRVANYVGEEPIIGALAALAAGITAGLILPVTRREQQVLEPYRAKAEEKLDELAHGVKEQVEGIGERIRGAKPQNENENEKQEDQDAESVYPTGGEPTLQ